jgi:three-Cys-motif partner protein
MVQGKELKFDEIGYWSELKLEIIEAYAKEYSKIISKQSSLHHAYIDAFAGAGMHKSKTRGDLIPGSPMKALTVEPPFEEYYLIDLNEDKADNLRKLTEGKTNVHIFTGDCNSVLLKNVFPNVLYKDYKRGLCLLDPYGLHLDWKVIETAGKMESLEIFLNFPIADMNRNVFWHNPDGVRDSDVDRMNAFWGDESWRSIAYTTEKDLFGHRTKEPNQVISESFKERLKNVAGFKYVSPPLPMRNSNNAIIYYLFFASQKPVSKKIVDYIFDKYSRRGVQ